MRNNVNLTKINKIAKSNSRWRQSAIIGDHRRSKNTDKEIKYK